MAKVEVNSLVNIASQIHRIALERELLMRGAITRDWQYHKGSNVMGKAKVDAVYLEENIAKYPRTVISNDIVDLITKYIPDFLIRKDLDGIYFIDYLRNLPIMLGNGAVINDVLIPALLNIRTTIKNGLLNVNTINDRAQENWN